jgi:hypothetical protein
MLIPLWRKGLRVDLKLNKMILFNISPPDFRMLNSLPSEDQRNTHLCPSVLKNIANFVENLGKLCKTNL